MGIYNNLTKKFTEWLTKEPPASEVPPYDYNRLKYEIRPGDVLLFQGRSRISNVIRIITQSTWTHAALYIGRFHDIEDHHLKKIAGQYMGKRENNRLIVEGILGKGNIVTPLSNYRNNHIRICRPIGLSHEDAQLVIAYAIKALGRPYSVRRLLDLARFLLPWSILPRRWGSSLFRTSTGELESGICSSLIAEAFSSVQFPILPFMKPEESGLKMIRRNTHLYTPADFDFSPYFEIIKYPILSAEEAKPYYRRFPWEADTVHHDHGIVEITKPKNSKPLEKKKFISKFIRKKRNISEQRLLDSNSPSSDNKSDDTENKEIK